MFAAIVQSFKNVSHLEQNFKRNFKYELNKPTC